ncbi:MAG: energy-coupling factor transporter transmembrane component T family protein [Syntrophomonadaceae bacterium]|jgi:energy-coupling factor transport system permease protein
MFGSISLGQYIPSESIIHRLDPRVKIITSLLFILVTFATPLSLELIFIYLVALILFKLSQLKAVDLWPAFRSFLIIVLVTVVLQILLIPGKSLFTFYIIKISYEGLEIALSFILRFTLLLFIIRLLTATTTPVAMMDGLEKILSPLSKLGFSVHELVMIMTISLRFIPLFMDEAERIRKAQLCRGADFRVGNLSSRIRNLFAWLLPLLRISIQRAEELSQAMEARAYNGGEGRTRLNELELTLIDYVYIISITIVLTIVIVI